VTSVALHHEVSGPDDAPAVLLGGSLGMTQAMWGREGGDQISTLAARYRVVSFDHRGHGCSPVPPGPYTIAELGGDVLALIERLGLTRAAYVGLSIGGMVGEWLAIHAPERISALVLICTTAAMDSPDPWRARAATVREAGSPEVVADAVVARWFTEGYTRSHPDVVARCRDMISGIAAEGYAGCCEAIAGLDLRAGLGQITAPTLVVAGAQDEAIPAAHGARLAEAIPAARFLSLDPGAHVPCIERAETVTALIADHLTGEI
jgi:3-oxoadipate enol-lactonase